MISKSLLLLSFLLPASRILAQTYITNVTVADVEHQKYIANQTVEIRGDKIAGIHPAENTTIPAGAITIDGEGKYLFPGLVDAHIHFSQSGGLYTRPDAIDLQNRRPYQEEIDWVHEHMDETLRRYLQNGITCVIDVGTTNNFLKHRATFTSSFTSPSIYMAGPLLTTYEPPALANLGDDGPFNLATSIDQAKNLVREQLKYHPDFIKIWYIVGRDTNMIEANARKHLPIVKAIINEAHINKTKVAIHATQRITAQLSVENGCDYLVHSVDDEILSDDFIQLLKKHNTILCPTLVVHNGYVNTFGHRLTMSEHEIRMSDPFQLGSLLDLKHLPDTSLISGYKAGSSTPERLAYTRTHNSNMAVNLKKLSDAGVIIATGT
ncbi:MAG TPA: amidohydrolase family protein, partial [Saprospiraceae bacterium]